MARHDSQRKFTNAVAVVILALATLTWPATAGGVEITVQNDSLTNFSQGSIQVGFVGGESAAAWLTSPCEGDIERLQILWMSLFGGAGDSLEEWIKVFAEGTFPVPGTEWVELSGPLMVDGGLNEFTLPSPLPVTAGETFVVSFKFLDTPPPLGPSLVTDVDGCQASRNGIFATPPSAWLDGCGLGLSGDFVIRAVVECAVAPATLTIFPPTGKIASTSRFDMTLLAEVPSGVTVTGATATLDGADVTSALQSCLVFGTLISPTGLTLRCPALSGATFGPGSHTLAVSLDFSNGSSAADTVTWDVLPNTEP